MSSICSCLGLLFALAQAVTSAAPGTGQDAPVKTLAARVIQVTDDYVKWGEASGLPPSLIVGKTARWVLIAVDKAELPGAKEREALDLAGKAETSEYGDAVIETVRRQVANDK